MGGRVHSRERDSRDRAEERALGPAWGSLPGLPGQTRGQASGTRCDNELSEQEEYQGQVPAAGAQRAQIGRVGEMPPPPPEGMRWGGGLD